ncbi:serine acetyltransferase [Solwaraspora sp. WMMD1047]|uniref:serine acetyltransferase n=1 Tax=Solwaraspora sp. WMMD1047 TaxID=3016102 RepID=UPI00241771D7|nr:serine acetyltransferase [Solwaraspora sp. WMMD1047]MDG4830135.1 serine acetyltransferase [Solwaraspora sp. WMMD1047]
MLDTLRQDFRRNRDPLARLVLLIFRFGQWTAEQRTIGRQLGVLPYKILNLLVVRLGTNSDLPRELRCGPGLRLFHPYGLVLHAGARLGAGIDLYHHVTIGRRDFSGEPVVGDEVTFGAGAAVLGPVVIGPRAKIGAGALVLDDVPAGGTALGRRAEIRPPTGGADRPGAESTNPPAAPVDRPPVVPVDRAESRSTRPAG